jgi:Uma2 family endonuclease
MLCDRALGEVELQQGVIIATTPESPAHAHCIRWLNRLFSRAPPDEHAVGEALPQVSFPVAELLG